MFLALVKVRKKDFCIVLARKQEKCSNRAPLTPPTKTASFPEGIAFKSQSDMLPPFQHFSTSCLNQCFHAVPVYKVMMHKLLSMLEWFWIIIFPLHQIPTTEICNELTTASSWVEGGCPGCPEASSVISQPLDSKTLPWLAIPAAQPWAPTHTGTSRHPSHCDNSGKREKINK